MNDLPYNIGDLAKESLIGETCFALTCNPQPKTNFAILRTKHQKVKMTNNDILKKLRVALKLRNDEIIEILKLVDFEISKSELDALFRDESHRNYRDAGDQVLRNFLNGLIIHLRGKKEE